MAQPTASLDHNDHFHRWLVRRLPASRRCALDVGCGQGELAARLAHAFTSVTAMDRDAEMVTLSTARLRTYANVQVLQASFQDVRGSFDLITMVAALHHMDLEVGLRHAADCLAPDGRLLVVGLAKIASRSDIAYDLASAALNPLVGLAKHARLARKPTSDALFPVTEPTLSFEHVRDVARRVLPGARLRRRLFFRYTLEWTKAAE